jgi:hypothetical protein
MIALFAGEKLGLATSPPYLFLISKANKNENNVSFINGVSFASAGAGIFDGTDERYVSHKVHFHFSFFSPFSITIIVEVFFRFYQPKIIEVVK